MSKDYERKVQTSETRIAVAMIRLLITRLGLQAFGVFSIGFQQDSSNRWHLHQWLAPAPDRELVRMASIPVRAAYDC
jgi:hypothetical protein